MASKGGIPGKHKIRRDSVLIGHDSLSAQCYYQLQNSEPSSHNPPRVGGRGLCFMSANTNANAFHG